MNSQASRPRTGSPAQSKQPTVIFVDSGSRSFATRQIKRWFTHEKLNPFMVFATGFELLKAIDSFPESALLIFNLEDPKSFRDLTATLDFIQAMDWHWKCRTLVLDHLDHPQIAQFLAQKGCAIVANEMGLQNLRPKIERYLRILEYGSQDELPTLLAQLSLSVNALPTFQIRWTKPLMLKNDHWLIPVGRFLYRTNGKWILSLKGPGSKLGSWKKIESPEDSTDVWWEWVFNTASLSLPRGEKGRWLYRGSKPQFQSSCWIFLGESPKLIFVADDRKVYARISALDEQTIEVAPNSSFALAPSVAWVTQQNNDHSRIKFSRDDIDKRASIFKPIRDQSKVESMLARASMERRPVRLWCSGNTSAFTGRLLDTPTKAFQIEIQVKNPTQARRLCQDHLLPSNRKIMGNFGLRSGAMFFTISKLEYSEKEKVLQIELDDTLYQVQRRKSGRMPIPPGAGISARINGVPRKPTDMSIGGLEFHANVGENLSCEIGASVQVELVFHGRQILVEAVVRWAKDLERSDGSTLRAAGLEFKALKPLDAAYLQLYLFELALDHEDSAIGESA
jgi:hypothetical protein